MVTALRTCHGLLVSTGWALASIGLPAATAGTRGAGCGRFIGSGSRCRGRVCVRRLQAGGEGGQSKAKNQFSHGNSICLSNQEVVFTRRASLSNGRAPWDWQGVCEPLGWHPPTPGGKQLPSGRRQATAAIPGLERHVKNAKFFKHQWIHAYQRLGNPHG